MPAMPRIDVRRTQRQSAASLRRHPGNAHAKGAALRSSRHQ
jgi:hypothetical protein